MAERSYKPNEHGAYVERQEREAQAKKEEQDRINKRLNQRSLSRNRQSLASTPNILGGGVRGRASPDRHKLLNSSNELSSLLEI